MEDIKIKHNYDKVIKEAMDLFKNHTLDFFVKGIAPIKEVLSTEITRIEAVRTSADKVFKLEDNTGLHLERVYTNF